MFSRWPEPWASSTISFTSLRSLQNSQEARLRTSRTYLAARAPRPPMVLVVSLGWAEQRSVESQDQSPLTSGEVYGSYGFTQTYQVFKADGVTPAPISTTPLLASALEPSSLVLIIPGIVAVYFGSRKRIFHAKANR
jgi:hypothetical protein